MLDSIYLDAIILVSFIRYNNHNTIKKNVIKKLATKIKHNCHVQLHLFDALQKQQNIFAYH